MCIQCLGHYSPSPLSCSFPPHPHLLPYFNLFCFYNWNSNSFLFFKLIFLIYCLQVLYLPPPIHYLYFLPKYVPVGNVFWLNIQFDTVMLWKSGAYLLSFLKSNTIPWFPNPLKNLSLNLSQCLWLSTKPLSEPWIYDILPSGALLTLERLTLSGLANLYR
jgi:hypothetical protein